METKAVCPLCGRPVEPSDSEEFLGGRVCNPCIDGGLPALQRDIVSQGKTRQSLTNVISSRSCHRSYVYGLDVDGRAENTLTILVGHGARVKIDHGRVQVRLRSGALNSDEDPTGEAFYEVHEGQLVLQTAVPLHLLTDSAGRSSEEASDA